MGLLPYVNSSFILSDGDFLHAPSYCLKSCGKSCLEYYKTIMQKGNVGIYFTCPHGMSSYVANLNGALIAITGLRERLTYNKRLSKAISNESVVKYNPVMERSSIQTLIDNFISTQNAINNVKIKEESLGSISHEIKQLNAQVKEHSEVALTLVENVNPDIDNIKDEIRSIFLSIGVYF